MEGEEEPGGGHQPALLGYEVQGVPLPGGGGEGGGEESAVVRRGLGQHEGHRGAEVQAILAIVFMLAASVAFFDFLFPRFAVNLIFSALGRAHLV